MTKGSVGSQFGKASEHLEESGKEVHRSLEKSETNVAGELTKCWEQVRKLK